MLKFILRAFSQTLPDSDVNCDVQCVSVNPVFATSIPCPPIPESAIGTGDGDWTNADLLAAVCEATGQNVELPEA